MNESKKVTHEATIGLLPPCGLAEILKIFGNIYEYVRSDGSLDPRWETDCLTRIELPFAITLSWDHTKTVSQMTCHQKLAEIFISVFTEILNRGLQPQVASFGGCFAFRPQRTGAKLSTHCWGVAIDLNPETNHQGTQGDMDPRIIEIFRDAGFSWGGDWTEKRRDPMHFQFCTGY